MPHSCEPPDQVHLGRGGPIPTRPTQGGNSRKLVFEASRPQAEGHTDHRLQANVYYGKGTQIQHLMPFNVNFYW